MINHPNDEIWNEHDWEMYIRSFEDQNQRLKSFYDTMWGSENPSWYRLIEELPSEKEVVDAFIEEELLIEESFFPDDDEDFDIDEDEDDLDEDLFGFNTSDDDDDEENSEPEDNEEDDEYELDEDDLIYFAMPELTDDDEEELDLYDRGREIAVSILKWHRRRSDAEKEMANMQRLVTIAMQIPTKIAAGFGFGFEPESIGGNIAYCKRALRLCNEAMDIFTDIKEQKSIKDKSYFFMQEELLLLRNDIGVYIQELRDLFTEATGK